MSKLSKKQIQDLMINMYPKRQIQEDTQTTPIHGIGKINDISHKSQPNDASKMMRQHVNIDPLNKISNKNNGVNKQSVVGKQMIFSLLIGIISVGLFSQFFLNVVENICIKKNISAFDINGRPKKKLLLVLFFIIVIVSRIFFSLN